MTNDKSAIRQEVFSFRKIRQDFDEAVTDKVRIKAQELRNSVLPPENVCSYSHGRSWIEIDTNDSSTDQTFETHSVQHEVKIDDIVQHNIKILPSFVEQMATAMHNSFMRTMYQKISDVSEKAGNVISQKETGSMSETFLRMLRKVEFGVNKDGTISRPEIHAGADVIKSMTSALEEGGDALRQEIEEITAEKEAAARDREAKRKAKFVRLSKSE